MRRQLSKRRKIALVVVAALVLVFGVLTERWFLHPRVDDPGTADAIFVLGGGGDRLNFALDLVRDGVATDVVFSTDWVEEMDLWAARPCNRRPTPRMPPDVTFTCFQPDPKTTRGEAQLLRDLAEDRGWETVVVVASTDRITRARRLIERCWDGEIRLTGPDHYDPFIYRAIYEWAAGAKATVLRGC